MELSLRSQTLSSLDALIDSPLAKLGVLVVGSGVVFGLVSSMFIGVLALIVF